MLGDLDKTTRRIEAKTAAMDDPELDAATLKVLAFSRGEQEIKVPSDLSRAIRQYVEEQDRAGNLKADTIKNGNIEISEP